VITAVIGIKEISERVENKNLRILGGQPLFCWIIDTLLSVGQISEIVINADGKELIKQLNSKYGNKIIVIEREDELKGHDVPMNKIILSSLDSCANEIILNTHVTNPFLKAGTIKNAIKSYSLEKTSVFSVSEYQSRFYTSELKPINHDPEVLLKTQNLDPLYEENSLMYIFSKKDFLQNRNRINKESRPFITPKLESIDIDTEDDWLLSTKLVQNLIK
jgi:CMP-N-acetylneuraminic acid synthetase